MQQHIYQCIKRQLIKNEVNIVGIHGPQGIGKTTLNKFLKFKFTNDGYKVLTLSIDDFYFEYNKMNMFLEKINDKIYKYRGLAGTHDIELLDKTLIKLINKENVKIPIFNKTIYSGFGDRDGYINIDYKPNLIILEGWMLAYKPKLNVINLLQNFNQNLKLYQPIQDKINIWIYLETDNLNNIYEWRWSAESKNGMDQEEFNKFMKPYFLVYQNYQIENKEKIIIDKKRTVII